MNKKEKTKYVKNNKGITLIALVVTIIVLIILAGISINLILGDNGIITKSMEAKENQRGADIKEIVAMRQMENVIIKYSTGKKYTKQDVIDELEAEGKLTEEEVELLNETDTITIGNIEIDFSTLEGNETTTGDSASETEITLSYNPPLSEYTNGSVVVTTNINTTEYTVEMSTDGTNWESVDSLTYDGNGKVYARLSDGTTILDEIEGEVNNIDKTSPEVGTLKLFYVDDNTEIAFDEDDEILDEGNYRVELVNGSDAESGHKKTTYSVKTEGASAEDESYEDLTETILLTKDDLVVFEGTTTTVSNIISSNENYEIIPLGWEIGGYNSYTFVVTTEDNAGNTSSITYKISISFTVQ